MVAPKSSCVLCGSHRKASTGECSMCGAYLCPKCEKLYYGPPETPCPGNGIPLPKAFSGVRSDG